MLKILKTRFKQGCRTLLFPKTPAPALPLRYRGRPVVADPSGSVDLGEISFNPDSDVVYSNDYRMAVSKREDLILFHKRDMVLARALNDRMLKIFGRSLKLRQVSAGGCNACELDLNVLNTPVFDLSRFGIQFVASPRHADGIVVTGPITKNMHEALLKTYEATPDPKLVIAIGGCAISGGIFCDSPQASRGLDTIIPVDLFIPGCPPHPLTILDGLLRMLDRLEKHK
ncbi:MAG: NADH-quinone oxidoreductase subunit B family protein [Candidatus Omnitrophica bacterium]|nr:NADH-quinone oxidoreductase subunit B family protein [Candidatus Omnitrophota bacterium]